ncbi:MAG: class I adenylate cyclase [Candidatus Hydrogenedentota bacterium]
MSIRELFATHNRKKITLLQECLPTAKWNAFCALPALLHYDIPSLTGRTTDETPLHGFMRPNFLPEVMPAAAAFFPELRKNPPQPRRGAFLGLFAMGSVGSSCFTSASDIDFWLVHPADAVSAENRKKLFTRMHAIEEWAMKAAELEIHFYIHDLGEIQKATFAYDEESAGEFGALLKDEFLRTFVHVAGLEPLSWGGSPALSIDFGAIPRLTTEQYLAACLAQLDKALEKPFKSALKVALLRRLAARPNDKLPAEVYAARIERVASPDSYMLLLEYLWDYFKSIQAEDDHTFLKSVLYLKMVAEETSPDRLRKNRERLLSAKFQEIGKPVDIDRLDAYFEWPIDTRIQFSNRIAKYLQTSLKEISGYGGLNLNPAKIRALTRKILLRAGTGAVIESLTFSDVPSRGEPTLSIIRDPTSQEWMLSLDRFSGKPDFSSIAAIKRAPSVPPLLAFALKNSLLVAGKTEIRGWPIDLFPRKIPEIREALGRLLDHHASSDALDGDSAPDRHLIIMEQAQGKDYSTRLVTVMTRTTWGVVEYRVFTGEMAFSSAIACILGMPEPKSGSEFFFDVATAPDKAEAQGILAEAFAGRDEHFLILKDYLRYTVIRDRSAFETSSTEELLIEAGRRGGLFRFARLPDDAGGRLISEILALIRTGAISIFTIPFAHEIGFLLVDEKGGCDAWATTAKEAPFCLAASTHYLSGLSRGRPVVCWKILPARRPGEDSLIEPTTAAAEGVDMSTELSFRLGESESVDVTFGARVMENQPMEVACALVARIIVGARHHQKYFPPFLTNLVHPPSVASGLSIPEASRRKREIEDRIMSALATMNP